MVRRLIFKPFFKFIQYMFLNFFFSCIYYYFIFAFFYIHHYPPYFFILSFLPSVSSCRFTLFSHGSSYIPPIDTSFFFFFYYSFIHLFYSSLFFSFLLSPICFLLPFYFILSRF